MSEKSNLLLPFIKMAISAAELLKMTDTAIASCETEDGKKAAAKMSMVALTHLTAISAKLLDDIIADRPCQCAECQRDRAEAMAQAESIFLNTP